MTKFFGCARNENLFVALFKRNVYIRRRDKTADRELVERSFAVHLFKEHLFTECTYSKRTYKRNVRLQRWNTSRNGGEQISAELTSHTSPFCNDYNKLQSFAFWSLCSFFPHAKNCAFIFLTHTQVRLFLTCGSPCVCSTSDCAVLLRSWRTKRGDITRGRYLSMRVPPVFPASDG